LCVIACDGDTDGEVVASLPAPVQRVLKVSGPSTLHAVELPTIIGSTQQEQSSRALHVDALLPQIKDSTNKKKRLEALIQLSMLLPRPLRDAERVLPNIASMLLQQLKVESDDNVKVKSLLQPRTSLSDPLRVLYETDCHHSVAWSAWTSIVLGRKPNRRCPAISGMIAFLRT